MIRCRIRPTLVFMLDSSAPNLTLRLRVDASPIDGSLRLAWRLNSENALPCCSVSDGK